MSAVRVENTSPKIMVLAIGPQITDVPPRPIAVGRRPAMVVTEVRTIGRSRVVAPSMTASATGTPAALRSLTKETRTMVSFTAIPASATEA